MADLLSSDILERQFGPTGLAVLYQNSKSRIVCARLKIGGQVLEVSAVKFIQAGTEKFPDAHQSVLAGQSMGKVFKREGIKFARREQAAYHQALPPNFTRWFGKKGKATVVNVSILVGPDKTPYADILEIYSPLVKWPRLKGQPTSDQLEAFSLLGKLLDGQPPA